MALLKIEYMKIVKVFLIALMLVLAILSGGCFWSTDALPLFEGLSDDTMDLLGFFFGGGAIVIALIIYVLPSLRIGAQGMLLNKLYRKG